MAYLTLRSVKYSRGWTEGRKVSAGLPVTRSCKSEPSALPATLNFASRDQTSSVDSVMTPANKGGVTDLLRAQVQVMKLSRIRRKQTLPSSLEMIMTAALAERQKIQVCLGLARFVQQPCWSLQQ